MDIKYGRKRNGIKKQLDQKINAWIKSIDDPDVQKLVARNTIVTGGSIASMLLGEPINDYDVYFRDKKTTLAVANYYVDKFNVDHHPLTTMYSPKVIEETLLNAKNEEEDRVVIFVESDGVAGDNPDVDSSVDEYVPQHPEELGEYRPVFLSANAITLSDSFQLVTRFYGEPSEIHENYDFEHAKNYYDFGEKALVLKPDALECLLSRTLVYRGSLYPVCSLFRLRKFIERGWRVSAGQVLKIAFQVSELDLNDLSTLREQLIGVDANYFHQIIKIIEEEKEKKNDMKIDSAYICEIIDRIFSEN